MLFWGGNWEMSGPFCVGLRRGPGGGVRGLQEEKDAGRVPHVGVLAAAPFGSEPDTGGGSVPFVFYFDSMKQTEEGDRMKEASSQLPVRSG